MVTTHGKKSLPAWALVLLPVLVCALSGCDLIDMLNLGGWDGSKPYQCGGSQSRTLEDLKIDYVPGSGPFADTAISAGGNCELTLVNCEITGGKVISAGGNAKIIIKGGRIEGKEQAILAGGNATVEVTGGAKIVGPVSSGGNGKIIGMPEQEKKQAQRTVSRKFSKGACKAVVPCYQKHEAFGNIQGLVSGKVNASGKVTGVNYSKGKAPKPVQQCLIQAMKAMKIANFDGQPGTLRCQYSGSITSGAQMLSTSPSFTRDK